MHCAGASDLCPPKFSAGRGGTSAGPAPGRDALAAGAGRRIRDPGRHARRARPRRPTRTPSAAGCPRQRRARAAARAVGALVRNSQPTVTLGRLRRLRLLRPAGNGAGYVEDFGHLFFPEYTGQFGWVFLGDILAPGGELARRGRRSRAPRPASTASTASTRAARPASSLNEVNLALRSALTPTAMVTASFNFIARTGTTSRWAMSSTSTSPSSSGCPPSRSAPRSSSARWSSVLGIEYRDRKSDKRFGITPSLIARYTTGTALGLKVRTQVRRRRLAGASPRRSPTARTPPSSSTSTTRSTATRGKTGSGAPRRSAAAPFDRARRLGQLRSAGSLHRQRAPDVVRAAPTCGALRARRPQGPVADRARADGEPPRMSTACDLHGGGYLEVDAMVTPSLGLLGRGEYRDASSGWAPSAPT